MKRKPYKFTQEEHDGPLSGYRRTCPICGEEFRKTTNWAYKKRYGRSPTVFLCSWTCLQEYVRRHDEMIRKGAEA